MEYIAAMDMIGPPRRASVAASTVSVPTPSRDLSFRRGAYKGNIQRLEQSAEEMSAGGSDIGEEIRRMNEADKLVRSRQNSVHGSQQGDHATLSRNSSYANSIVAVNSNARVGGYSPAAFITSPVGSAESSRQSISRHMSTDPARRLSNMIEMEIDDQPLDLSFGDHDEGAMPTRQSSYARGDDRAALRLSTYSKHDENKSSRTSVVLVSRPEIEEQEGRSETPPVRPSSTDTFQQAQTAFIDFDGTHCSPDMEEFIQLDQDGNEIRRISGRKSSGESSARLSTMLAPSHDVPLGAPPPEAGMVYYPAPVPRMLNLPKRLSQLPVATVQAKRRSQVMSQMINTDTANRLSRLPAGDRMSRLPEEQPSRGQLNERLSIANFSNVPPQLRASVFFEHQTVVHDVEVESESAVATLDSILAASATAPVSAFTDHPYAGDISKTVYAPERTKRSSTMNDLRMSTALPPTDRRSKLVRASTATVLGGTRASTYSLLEPQGDARNSRTSVVNNARPASRMPMHEGIAEEDEDGELEDLDGPVEDTPEDDFIQDEMPDFDDDEDIDPTFAQPTTLLAELQVRKAQLKSRSRTAAAAFPNGMHSTLLELDSVAAIDKKKRSHQRVALAWEDPNLREDDAAKDAENDEVPLGMLFPAKNGAAHHMRGDNSDWDRPLGLMEKRAMEDNEPLSSRRSRLRGEPIVRPRPVQQVSTARLREDAEADAAADDETAEQKLRRISSKNALDAAIADAVPGDRPLSTFTDDVINQLSLDAPQDTSKTPDPESETLGQRRARLQREKEAAAALQSRNSMANLLASYPVGQRKSSREQVATRGTLLYANDLAQAEHKRNMLASNMRSTSYQRPLTNALSTTNMMSPMMPGYGNMLQTSASTPMFGMQNAGYFQGAVPGYTFAQPAMMNPYAQMYPQTAMQGMHYMPMTYSAGFQPTIQQRSAIDQWRSNIAQ